MAACALRMMPARRSLSEPDMLQLPSTPLSTHDGFTVPAVGGRGSIKRSERPSDDLRLPSKQVEDVTAGTEPRSMTWNMPQRSPISIPLPVSQRSSVSEPASEITIDYDTSDDEDAFPTPSAVSSPPPSVMELDLHRHDYMIIPRAQGGYLGIGASATVSLAIRTGPNHADVATGDSARRLPNTSQQLLSPSAIAYAHHDVYAIKVPFGRQYFRGVRHEAEILTHLHRASVGRATAYIIPFFGLDARNHGLVLGYGHQTLRQLLQGVDDIPESTRAETIGTNLAELSRQLVSGMAFMHSAGIVHGDIKPSNIMVRSDAVPVGTLIPFDSDPVQFTILYTDFNSSFFLSNDPFPSDESTSMPVEGQTLEYSSPELLHVNSSPTPASDVWALSMTLLEIFTGRNPFEDVRGHRAQKMAMIAQGIPAAFAKQDPRSARRLKATKALKDGRKTWGAQALLEHALDPSPDTRIKSLSWELLVTELNQ